MMKRIKKNLMVFGFLLSGSLFGYAQDKVPGVIIELTNGEKVECRLVDNPKLVFDGTKISFTTKVISVEYTPTDFQKLTMGEVENVSSDINELKMEQGDIQVSDGFVRFSNFSDGEDVRIFSISGVLMQTYHISADGTLVLPVSSLPTGISIIKANKQTIKITKR